jgi:hypothetical protein
VPGAGNKSEGRFNRRRADKTARMQYGNYPIALLSIPTNRQPDEFLFFQRHTVLCFVSGDTYKHQMINSRHQ